MPQRSKVQVEEWLPVAFADFMVYVIAKINEGAAVTRIPSGDLIQCEHTFGGLVKDSEGIFQFEFMNGDKVDEDGFSISWHYVLTVPQIAAIASHETQSMTMWRCVNDCGRRASVPVWYCTQCDFPP